ncbi:MAG: bifunctional DNA-formamidopyrimidine glycosylase/DNA-(apurinic or apyrimidinic site) lyase [Chloroflexi bacterium]|nr:bifunctional DNA-formamidopyrimidine glycosylase/DNA-(apurinic or apyrimidinic site) lyase [Chloroflexota bacterium]
MPELPEVETIKNDLAPHLVGQRFTGVKVRWPKLVKQPSPEELQRRLPGHEIKSLSRRGKYLIFHLSPPEDPLANSPSRTSESAPLLPRKAGPREPRGIGTRRTGQALVFHLKMTGQLLYPATPDRYTSALFTFQDGSCLVFSDKRRLGALWLVPAAELIVGTLGPEPLDAAFNPQTLAHILARRSAPIKAVLLDQKALAGVGNLYADEALFQARLHPLRPAKSLSRQDVKHLHRAIQEVLLKAINNRGSTFSDYRTPDGASGRHQESFQVAHRKGAPCPRCGTSIQRLAIRNRGSCFCPGCQR